MITSGNSTWSTSGTTPVQIIPAQSGLLFSGGAIVKDATDTNPIEYSVDGSDAPDNQWAILPASASANLPGGLYLHGLYIRKSGDADGAGVSAEIY